MQGRDGGTGGLMPVKKEGAVMYCLYPLNCAASIFEIAAIRNGKMLAPRANVIKNLYSQPLNAV